MVFVVLHWSVPLLRDCSKIPQSTFYCVYMSGSHSFYTVWSIGLSFLYIAFSYLSSTSCPFHSSKWVHTASRWTCWWLRAELPQQCYWPWKAKLRWEIRNWLLCYIYVHTTLVRTYIVARLCYVIALIFKDVNSRSGVTQDVQRPNLVV